MTSIRSFTQQFIRRSSIITIVSGLPRSGTSMMMSALQNGGMALLIDDVRIADQNNPRGYYEYQPVKKLEKGSTHWLRLARGKAVKIISVLLEYLPDCYQYRVIFMERDMDQVLASQARMLEREGREDKHPVSDVELKQNYERHLLQVKAWLGDKGWIQPLFVSYNQILCQPIQEFVKVAAFLDHKVAPERMAQVVDFQLYREHS